MFLISGSWDRDFLHQLYDTVAGKTWIDKSRRKTVETDSQIHEHVNKM